MLMQGTELDGFVVSIFEVCFLHKGVGFVS